MASSTNLANRGLPTPVPDGTNSATSPADWVDKYGARLHRLLFGKGVYSVADAGQYFIGRNPTPGTGLADHAAPTTLDDTKPFILLSNQDVVGQTGSKRVYLDYVKLICTGPGTNGTAINVTTKIDADTPARYSSGGTNPVTVVNPNYDSKVQSVCTLRAGAITAAAANNARLLNHQQVRTVIPIIGDTYIFDFGSNEFTPSSMIVAGAAVATLAFPMVPTIIGPGQCFALHKWLPAQSVAGAWEFELGWWEI